LEVEPLSGPRKLALIVTILLVGVALVYVSTSERATGPQVEVEAVERRTLEAIVSASGKIEPKLSVDISASTMGKVTRLAFNEGDRVESGQFLLEIDPKSLRTAVDRGEASLQATRSSQRQAEVGVATAEVNLKRAKDNLMRQEHLWELRLISREVFERAANDVALRETELEARQVEVTTQAQRIKQEEAGLDSARYELTKVTITAPIDGMVTRRNIEEGETVVLGTMNNQGTVLATVADLSVIEAEVEVDETDIPAVELGQMAEVTIDALPNRSFTGIVTEIGNSPTLAAGAAGTQATTFKVVVTLDDEIPDVRPGFTCTADITTAIRANSLAIPIQAATVREVVLDERGEVMRADPQDMAPTYMEQPEAGGDRDEKELEGVFVARQEHAVFLPVETGIAGERYFEALTGVTEGDLIIIGPFSEVRNIEDGDEVRVIDDDDDGSDESGLFGRLFSRRRSNASGR
jgi:HlyD family secretion protein